MLGSAQRTIDVCVFTITCDEIADTLLKAHARGVRVRIITDNDQCGCGVCVGRLSGKVGSWMRVAAGKGAEVGQEGASLACPAWASTTSCTGNNTSHNFEHASSPCAAAVFDMCAASTQGSDIDRLRAAGVPVKMDADSVSELSGFSNCRVAVCLLFRFFFMGDGGEADCRPSSTSWHHIAAPKASHNRLCLSILHPPVLVLCCAVLWLSRRTCTTSTR